MKVEKEQYYSNRILEILLENELVTVSFIAEKVGIVEKSVRTRLKAVGTLLEDHNLGKIRTKQRVGVWLEATREQRNALQNTISDSTSEWYIQDAEERVNEVIRAIFLMKPSKPLTIIKMASMMYLSTPTLLGIFKQAVEWFDKNGIKVFSVRNKGICIEATEAMYRRALKQFILKKAENKNLQDNMKLLLPGMDILKVREILLKTEEQWRLSFSDYSFNEIWVTLCIAIFRMNGTKAKVDITNEEAKIINHNEYSFAQTLYERVETEFNIKIENHEVIFLAEEILCANYLDGNLSGCSETGVSGYDLKLREFVSKIISTISAIIDEDLIDDRILFNSLLQHIGPAIFRMRYRENASESSILGYVKNDYKEVYRAAWATSFLFEEFFDIQVTEEELIYVTLYVQVALERRSRPLRAVLVTQTGPGHSQLLCEKIKRFIPQIKEIDIARVQGFKYEKCAECDIVLSTVPLSQKEENCILIDLAMSDETVMLLRKQVRKIIENIAKREERLDPLCYSLLQPKLMFTSIEAKSKEEIIKFLTSELEQYGYVSSDYFKSVMKREQATTTAIGNGVAIPHGFTTGVHESKVCICTLKNPIPWNNEMVDVIFFLAVRMTTPQEAKYIQLFYKHFIQLTATDEKVDILRKIPSGAEMYKYLIG